MSVLSIPARVKRSLPLLVPVLLAACFLRLLEFGFTWRETRAQELAQATWERSAKGFLGMLASSCTVESQIESMGRRMTAAIEAGLRRAPAGATPERLCRLFQRCFSKTHRPAGTRLYACSIDDKGDVTLMSGAGLASGKARVMEELFRILLSQGTARPCPPVAPKAARRLMRGLLGEDTDPAMFSPSRTGLVTPVLFEGRKHLLYWNIAEGGPAHARAFLLLFPADAFARHLAVRHTLFATFSRSGGRFVPYLHPFPQNRDVQAVSLSHSLKGNPLSSAWKECRALAAANPGLPAGGVIRTPRFWAMKGFFSCDHPLQAWIFSEPPHRPSMTLQRLRFAGLAATVAFALLLPAALLFDLTPFVSLRISFGFLLLFIGLAPLSLLLLIGTSAIELQAERLIRQTVQETLEQLSEADHKTSFVHREFLQAADELASSPSYINICISSDTTTVNRSGAQAHAFFRNRGIELDVMHVYRPGGYGAVYPSLKPNGDSNQEKCDFFAPIVRLAHADFVPETPESGLPRLTDTQKSYQTVFSSIGLDTTRNFYLNFLEHAETFRLMGGETSLYLSQTFSDRGIILAHVIYEAAAEKALRRQLVTNLVMLAIAGHTEFAVGETKPGGMIPFYPKPVSAAWSTRTGIRLKRAMEAAARLKTEVISRADTTAFIAVPCRKAGNYVTGASVSLRDILDGERRNRHLLLLFATAFAGILYLLGRLMLEHLIMPLGLVEDGLRKAAAGGDPGKLALPRTDELGRMTNAFDEMIDGLRERQYLGKFVSGALEQNLSSRAPDQAVQPRSVTGTLLVSDIRSFTTMSETHPADEIVTLLNRHMAALTPGIERLGGRVDRFIGDAIVAVFEDESRESGVRRAVQAGLAMMESHGGIQASRAAAGLFRYEIGIGIDCGTLMLGTLGSRGRLEFAIVGESRHVAEEMEALSKLGTATRIVLSPAANALATSFAETAAIGEGDGFELVGLRKEGA